MQQYVGVAMTDQLTIVRDGNSTHNQRTTGLEPMGIMANSNTLRH
jgi:hypothetical protein